MKEYSGENIFIGCINDFHGKIVGNIARVHNGNYFSIFMEINNNSYFDLSSNYLYTEDESFKIIKFRKLNSNKNFSERKLKKLLIWQLKTL